MEKIPNQNFFNKNLNFAKESNVLPFFTRITVKLTMVARKHKFYTSIEESGLNLTKETASAEIFATWNPGIEIFVKSYGCLTEHA